MKWIAITGNIGSGKSQVLTAIRTLGWPVVDADSLARQAVCPGTVCLVEIRAEFGSGVFTNEGCLDRGKLAKIIFADKKMRLRLEQIVHPEIHKLAENYKRQFQQQGSELAFYEVPLLFEKGLESEFDAVVLVAASEASRRLRIAKRDALSAGDIDQRFSSQLNQADKISRATYVIWNDDTLETLYAEVAKMVKFILKSDNGA